MVIADSARPPDRIEPDGAVIVMPLPLSLAKPIHQPTSADEGVGRVTAIEAPGAL